MHATTRGEHQSFLNRYYGLTRPVYDVTRRYFLLGRDRAIGELLREPWGSLIDVGVGTGRNLARLRAERPWARYGGVDASDAMLEASRRRLPWAALRHGFAEDVDLPEVLGAPPERILFSYVLSMVVDPMAALRNARRALAPGGKIVVVDFADLTGLPAPLRWGLLGYLAAFRVRPLDPLRLESEGARVRVGPAGYYLIAELGSIGGWRSRAQDPGRLPG
ncbi:MAG: class I SAM-dependent methyltransferase [Nannocystaceae bacterium]